MFKQGKTSEIRDQVKVTEHGQIYSGKGQKCLSTDKYIVEKNKSARARTNIEWKRTKVLEHGQIYSGKGQKCSSTDKYIVEKDKSARARTNI